MLLDGSLPLILAQADAAPAAQQPPSIWNSLIFMALIFGAMYFLMIAPQRKKQKEHEKLLASLGSGDEILTTGGIFDYLRANLPGFNVEMIDHGAGAVSLYAVRGTPKYLFNVHLDTVPDSPHWSADPHVMRRLDDWMRASLPPSAYVSLLADGEAHRLYAQFGFEPTAPASIGMYRRF